MTTPGQSNEQIRSLATVLKKDDTVCARIVKAVITAANPAASPPSIDVQIGGDTSTTVKEVRYLDSYTPVVGDTCLIIQQGADVFALGTVDDSTEGTSANGWQTPTLNSNYTTNGNSNGPLLFRMVNDNGDRKVQFKGSVALTGSPGSAICTLPAAYFPSAKRSLLVSRTPSGGSNVEQVDVQVDGQIVRVGSTIGITGVTLSSTSTSSGEPVSGHGTGTGGEALTDVNDAAGDPHKHQFGHHHDTSAHTHTPTSVAVTAPTWIGFSGVEYFI